MFSSENDDRFSFEDMLDLFSVLSEKCPLAVKASWAFQIYGRFGLMCDCYPFFRLVVFFGDFYRL